jgi:hypothetical protein
MRRFKTPSFHKSLIKSELTDTELNALIDQVGQGLIDVHLGGELIKQRIARPNTGKRDGYRTVIAFRHEERAIFLHLFAKNEKANISKKELEALKAFAKHFLAMSQADLNIALKEQALLEIKNVKNS